VILNLTASSDTYITNKIINNQFSASDANVGRAGTIDMFKLYNESTLTGSANEPYSTDKVELSRALIKFDYSPLHALTQSKLDFTNSSFKAELLLFDVMGGQAVPTDFTLSVYPLARAFDEGNGRDVAAFRDIDVANYYSSSFSGGTATLWVSGGANASGSSDGPESVDYFASGNIAGFVSTNNFEMKQAFVGSEDLKIDVTSLVSASLAGQFTNHGFRLSFTGSQESDQKTYFVKRFGSSQARNQFYRPLLRVSFDDTIIDHHESFFFDLSGSIFLNSFERGRPAAIKSGSTLTSITGSDSLLVNIVSGSYSKFLTASQHSIAGDLGIFVTGVYSASFAITSFDTSVVNGTTTISDYVRDSGSITFDTYWQSLDTSLGYHTGSLLVTKPQRFSFNQIPKDVRTRIVNLMPEYGRSEVVKLRVFVQDFGAEPKSSKFAFRERSTVVERAYYRVKDVLTGRIIIPFMESNNGTRMSSDSDGLYFEFDMSALFPNRAYTFEFKVIDSGETEVLDSRSVFKVV
jgi:hypothetical protein